VHHARRLTGYPEYGRGSRLETIEFGAVSPAAALHEFLAMIAKHDDDGVIEQFLFAQMIDDAPDLTIDVMGCVDVAVLDLADVGGQIGGQVIEIFEVGFGNGCLGREVVTGVG